MHQKQRTAFGDKKIRRTKRQGEAKLQVLIEKNNNRKQRERRQRQREQVLKETGKGQQRRERMALTGIENLHLALQSLQEAARGKEERCGKKRMRILGHARDSEPCSVLCRLPGHPQ